MGLLERIKRLETQTKEIVLKTIEFCGYKISTKNLVDDWVQAVIETSEEDANKHEKDH